MARSQRTGQAAGPGGDWRWILEAIEYEVALVSRGYRWDLYRAVRAPTCLETADANNDGTIDLPDGIAIFK